jgi:alcohol dehydrogenase class IV
MRFEFATSGRIVFGTGALAEITRSAPELGSRAMVVTGRDVARARRLLDLLADSGVAPVLFAVAGEPTIADAQRGSAAARAAGCDCVIGFGGGSALDAAKAIAALLTNDGDIFEYLEVIGRGRLLPRPGAPCIAIPTTAGTGSEVTRNAVLVSPAHRVKVSLRSPHLLPRLALVDPELTHRLPPALTATTGLDALTQLIEPYVSGRANPVTDALCIEGIRRVARSLRNAVARGDDAPAREDMALASLFGGLALANAGLGAVHGFAGPIGGMFPAPHGAVCAALLPHVAAANIAAMRRRESDAKALGRYGEIAGLLTNGHATGPEDVIPALRELVQAIAIPSLEIYGITRADIPAIAGAAAQSSSMKANPVNLTTAELVATLEAALPA